MFAVYYYSMKAATNGNVKCYCSTLPFFTLDRTTQRKQSHILPTSTPPQTSEDVTAYYARPRERVATGNYFSLVLHAREIIFRYSANASADSTYGFKNSERRPEQTALIKKRWYAFTSLRTTSRPTLPQNAYYVSVRSISTTKLLTRMPSA
jgi:hypothetical protein